MATPPDWDNRLQSRIGEASDAKYLNAAPARMTPNDEQPEPTRSHKACIAELILRFPCPQAIDPDDYDARAGLLTRDTAHLAPSLLRKACDLAAQTARGLPYASEILVAAAIIVEERQRALNDTMPPERRVTPGDKAGAYARANLAAVGRGSALMQTETGDLIKLGSINERRGIRYDGSVIEPWFHSSKGEGDTIPPGWYCLPSDAAALSSTYSNYNAAYRMRSCLIVDGDA